MRKGYTEPDNYFPAEVLKKFPPKGGKTTAKSTAKKTTTAKKATKKSK